MTISKLMGNLDYYKYNPSAMQQVIFDCLDEITSGEVDIVDPTNPFVFLLESSTVNTAVGNSEALTLHRKLYPSLIQSESDIYLHMSDKDYTDRFGSPAETVFTFMIEINDLSKKMVFDTSENCYKAIIPRDTEVRVDDLVYTLQYPIIIRKYANGTTNLTYDVSYISPLQVLSTNTIYVTERANSSGVKYLYFSIPLYQLAISTSYKVLSKSSMFVEDITYTDNFHYARVYYKNSQTNGSWVEVITTHTDQVYDPYKATAVLKVLSGTLTVFIPPIYLNSGLISGDLRVDVYTTKGPITINFNNYKLDAFKTVLKTIDQERDVSVYSNAMLDVSMLVFTKDLTSGGTDPITFSTLREKVIFNSVGDEQIPISHIQVETHVNNRGFDLVKNVDVITNRIFLATKKLPKPINEKLISPANMGISTLILDLKAITNYSNVRRNGERVTLLSSNLYINTNGIHRLLNDTEVATLGQLSLTDKVKEVNSRQYVYTPFHYVLDNTANEFEVRVYSLDYPVSSNLSFISQNQTLELNINIGKYLLEKVATGYKLTIATRSDSHYKLLGDAQVGMQLGFYPDKQTRMVYINGTQVSRTGDNERVFSFNIDTSYDINNNHALNVRNALIRPNETLDVWMSLDTELHLFHTTTSLLPSYKPDAAGSLFNKSLLPTGSACVTHETITARLGYALKNLWSRSRLLPSSIEYQTYTTDIPMTYVNDVYKIDPITNSIFQIDANGDMVYNIAYHKGDVVLDTDGKVVMKYRKGDPVLDSSGNPILISKLNSLVEFDMLMVDARYYFATDTVFVDYRKELVDIITNWITVDLNSLQDLLLEQTKIYYYSKTSLADLKVYANEAIEKVISAEQSLVVDLYVKDAIFNNTALKEQLTTLTVKVIDDYIGNNEVNLTILNQLLADVYNDSVVSLRISNLGGKDNYNIVIVRDFRNRLCLKKKLMLQQDGTFVVKEDVTINFYNLESLVASN
jgi:hypothetical protein